MSQFFAAKPLNAHGRAPDSYADGGKTVMVTDSLERTWTVKKNNFGQVYEEIDPAGNITEYFYMDGRLNMTKKIETEKLPDGTTETHTTEYKYNAFNKVEQIKEHVGTAAEAITTLTYDQQGKRSETAPSMPLRSKKQDHGFI